MRLVISAGAILVGLESQQSFILMCLFSLSVQQLGTAASPSWLGVLPVLGAGTF